MRIISSVRHLFKYQKCFITEVNNDIIEKAKFGRARRYGSGDHEGYHVSFTAGGTGTPSDLPVANDLLETL